MRDIIDLYPSTTPAERTQKIIEDVADSFGVSVESIMGRNRKPLIVKARHAAVYAVRTRTRLSLPQMGKLFNRDHSTLSESVRQHERRVGLR